MRHHRTANLSTFPPESAPVAEIESHTLHLQTIPNESEQGFEEESMSHPRWPPQHLVHRCSKCSAGEISPLSQLLEPPTNSLQRHDSGQRMQNSNLKRNLFEYLKNGGVNERSRDPTGLNQHSRHRCPHVRLREAEVLWRHWSDPQGQIQFWSHVTGLLGRYVLANYPHH